MTVDDLQDLYGELRGSRSAGPIMDARAFFLERQYIDAHAKLDEAYQTYRESRMRILRQDPEKDVDPKAKDRDRQVRRLKRKQEKARDLIEKFEDFLPQLQRLADKERSRNAAIEDAAAAKQASDAGPPSTQEDETEGQTPPLVSPEAIDESFREQFKNLIGDRQLDLVSDRFGFVPLADLADVKADAVYLLRKSDRCLLVRTEVDPSDPESFDCIDICREKNRTRLTRKQIVRLSVKRRLVRLTEK